MRTSGEAGEGESKEVVEPVFSLFLGRSPSSESSISDNFRLDDDEGRVDDALDAPFGSRKPLGIESGSTGPDMGRIWGSMRVRPGISSLNKSHALADELRASWGSGRRGLELGTRMVPEGGGGGGKYRDVAVASLDCGGGAITPLSLLDVHDGAVGAAE